MSDIIQAQQQNLSPVADAPPTQPQGLPEAPTLQQVRAEAEVLPLLFDAQTIRELYAHFGVKSAEDLAEPDRREFFRLTHMSDDELAEVFRSKRTAPSTIAVQPNAETAAMRDLAVERAREGFRVLPIKKGTKKPAQPYGKPVPPKGEYYQHIPSSDPAEVARMWTSPTGPADFDIGHAAEGMLILDQDDRDGRTGKASFHAVALEHGLNLDTVVASTPSGGRHYFYRLPADIDPTTVKFGSDKSARASITAATTPWSWRPALSTPTVNTSGCARPTSAR